MAKTTKRRTGDLGEEVVCKYLTNKGFSVLERNYLRKWGEIDVIAQKVGKLHFVEVKTVTREPSLQGSTLKFGQGSTSTYRPEENVHPAKLKRLHRAVQTYLIDHKVPEETNWQIDVACVYLDMATRKAHVEMLENVIL